VALASSSYENSPDFSTLMPMILAGLAEFEVPYVALPETSSERKMINKSYCRL